MKQGNLVLVWDFLVSLACLGAGGKRAQAAAGAGAPGTGERSGEHSQGRGRSLPACARGDPGEFVRGARRANGGRAPGRTGSRAGAVVLAQVREGLRLLCPPCWCGAVVWEPSKSFQVFPKREEKMWECLVQDFPASDSSLTPWYSRGDAESDLSF